MTTHPAPPQAVPDVSPGAGAPGGKGLAVGKLGVVGGAVIGIACVAPAYTLSSSLGSAAGQVGYQVPAVLLVCLVPMLLVLVAYRELNTAIPDAGTSFTWVTRAFGPWAGWMAGWALMAATAIVLSSLAGVATTALFALLGQVTGDAALGEIAATNPAVDIAVTAVLTLGAGWISYRGVDATERLQVVLVALQVIAFGWFAVAAFSAVGTADTAGGPAPEPISASWFDPFAVADPSTLLAGISLCVFVYWGWDTVVTMNEEAVDPERTPVRAAFVTVAITVGLFLLVSIAALAYAGTGTTGAGLGNADNQSSVLTALASGVMGSAAPVMFVAVLCSALASLQSTITSPSRTLLAMGHFGAVPAVFRRTSLRHCTPTAGIVSAIAFAIGFYTLMRLISTTGLADTVAALGLLVSFYYSLTALAAVWYFRRTWFRSARDVALRLVLPLFGGLALLSLFAYTAVQAADPSYGSGSSVAGIGTVFIAGVGTILVGAVLMVVRAVTAADFFRGRTLARAAA